jgi:hypothetical protein
MARQIDLFDLIDPSDPQFERYTCKNPMVRKYGFGPEGTKCKTCKFLCHRDMGKRYYKCEKRGLSRSETTDHRVNFPACIFYESDVP